MVAAKYLKKEGHTILGSIQNASGHGFDLVTKTADGYINVIEVKTSGNKWRSKSNMGGWTRKNIEKITVTPMVCGLANPNIKTICLQ